MNKLILSAFVLLALVVIIEARGRQEVAAREKSFNGERAALRKGNRGRLGLRRNSGLRKGNRARGRRGRGARVSAGNRLAAERYQNHKEHSDVAAVNDLRKSNRFALQLEQNNDVARHRAVSMRNGMEHADGERVKAEEVLDKEHYDNEAVDAENLHEEHDNLAVDGAEESILDARHEREKNTESDFFAADDGGKWF